MKLIYQFVVQNIGDSYMAVAINEGANKFKGMIKLNETGKDIFEALNKETTKDEIVELLYAKYDASKEDLAKSVDALVNQLIAKGLVK